jgi:glycosyltransferase involved in cell wall biosynthesis
LLEHAVRSLGIPADRVILMRNHVDARFYRPIPAAQSHRLRLCAAGFARRDYDTLVEAVARLPDVTLTVDPSGHPLRLARRCLPTVPVPENATFVSFPPGGLRDLYGPSDVVCVPLHDGASTCGVTTLLEGMAMGKPVVVTGTIGLDDLIADGETGFKVAPGDVDGWVAAIRRLRDDPLLRARMGENARHWVMHNATIELWSDTIKAAIGRTATRNIQDCGPTPVPGEVSARAKVR